MPTNFFVPVAAAAGANVTTDAAWDGSSFQVTGVTKGIVPSAGMNKAWRQGTMGTSALGQMIVDHGLIDAVDDGNVPGLKANLRMALAAMLAGVAFAVDTSSTANLLVVALDPAPPTLSTYRHLYVRVANTNTGPVTLTLNNLGTKSVVKKNGLPLNAGDINSGQFAHVLYDLVAGQYVLAGAVASDFAQNNSVSLISGGRLLFDQSTPGTYTYTVPANIFTVKIQVWGGGGAGGGCYGSGSAGTGGAGGGYSDGAYAVTPGQVLTIVVGAGGTGVAGSSSGGGNGNTGSTSSVSGAGVTGLPIAATGGQGGGGALNAIAVFGSQPGNGSGGQTNRAGTGGGTGVSIPSGIPLSGVGGSAYTTSIPGGNQNGPGSPGNFPGGGGSGASGASANAGGNGANGWVRIFG